MYRGCLFALTEKGKNIHRGRRESCQKLNTSQKKKRMEVKREGRMCMDDLTSVESNAAISVMRDGGHRFMTAMPPRK